MLDFSGGAELHERLVARAARVDLERRIARQLKLTHAGLVYLDKLMEEPGTWGLGQVATSLIRIGLVTEERTLTFEGTKLVRRARRMGL